MKYHLIYKSYYSKVVTVTTAYIESDIPYTFVPEDIALVRSVVVNSDIIQEFFEGLERVNEEV